MAGKSRLADLERDLCDSGAESAKRKLWLSANRRAASAKAIIPLFLWNNLNTNLPTAMTNCVASAMTGLWTSAFQ